MARPANHPHRLSIRIDSETAEALLSLAEREIKRTASTDVELSDVAREVLAAGLDVLEKEDR